MQAIRIMKEQRSAGHIFNMDGAGADGGATPRFAAYGAAKRGLVQLSKSLQVCSIVYLCFKTGKSCTRFDNIYELSHVWMFMNS